MPPFEQPQPTPTPRRTVPDPYAADEPPRPIPGEPRLPQRPPSDYSPQYGFIDHRANSAPGARVVSKARDPLLDRDIPLDPTVPAQPLMPEIAERKHRELSGPAAVVDAARQQPLLFRGEDLQQEVTKFGEDVDALVQEFRRGERSRDFEQRISRLTEQARQLLQQVREEAAQSLSPDAVSKKCAPLEQVIEEEGRVLQWMYAAVGIASQRPSVEQLFHSSSASESETFPGFFRTTVDTLDGIRIRAEQLTQQPVPPSEEVERIASSVRDAGAKLVQYMSAHPFAETPASTVVFGYIRALKALGDTLSVTADRQPYVDRIDQVAYQHQSALKKIVDFFASTSANVLLQVDEQRGAVGDRVA